MLLEVARRTLALARPFESYYGSLQERQTLTVTLRDDEGLCGRGEAAPLEHYDNVSLERAERALRAHAGVLEALAGPPAGADEQERWLRGALDACARADALPQALAAIDGALWELAARTRNQPLYRLLAELVCPDAPKPVDVPASVPVSATVAALDRANASEQAAQAARAGYPCLKLKVGAGDDAGRVAAVRAAAGPDIGLRLDANGAWQVQEAVAAIGALAPAGLELVEEPVHGASALREVRERVEVRIAADESANVAGALDGAVDAVCLKLAASGGPTPLLGLAARARASGCEVYLGSTLEGPVGIAAAVHTAAALASGGPMPPCGLATLELFAGLGEVLPIAHGEIAVPQGAGLGVADDDARER
jgi:L-alanine-DL-glutamate epimerase-like enolase superfamily enzyme